MKNHKICTKLQNYWPKGKNKEIFTLLRVLQQFKYYLKGFFPLKRPRKPSAGFIQLMN